EEVAVIQVILLNDPTSPDFASVLIFITILAPGLAIAPVLDLDLDLDLDLELDLPRHLI
ncbi:hypothetical protein ACHAO5_005869, partial [Verticillium nonalfalfae]